MYGTPEETFPFRLFIRIEIKARKLERKSKQQISRLNDIRYRLNDISSSLNDIKWKEIETENNVVYTTYYLSFPLFSISKLKKKEKWNGNQKDKHLF